MRASRTGQGRLGPGTVWIVGAPIGTTGPVPGGSAMGKVLGLLGAGCWVLRASSGKACTRAACLDRVACAELPLRWAIRSRPRAALLLDARRGEAVASRARGMPTCQCRRPLGVQQRLPTLPYQILMSPCLRSPAGSCPISHGHDIVHGLTFMEATATSQRFPRPPWPVARGGLTALPSTNATPAAAIRREPAPHAVLSCAWPHRLSTASVPA